MGVNSTSADDRLSYTTNGSGVDQLSLLSVSCMYVCMYVCMYIQWDTVDLFPPTAPEIKEKRKSGQTPSPGPPDQQPSRQP